MLHLYIIRDSRYDVSERFVRTIEPCQTPRDLYNPRGEGRMCVDTSFTSWVDFNTTLYKVNMAFWNEYINTLGIFTKRERLLTNLLSAVLVTFGILTRRFLVAMSVLITHDVPPTLVSNKLYHELLCFTHFNSQFEPIRKEWLVHTLMNYPRSSSSVR